ncbi:MAG TPA: dTMP kinase [Thermoplasmata archaeon]|nr:dTMP kinase [Thermoplasmata archaeon]
MAPSRGASAGRPPFATFGVHLPRIREAGLKGRLIVIEGADGSGRTTECELLREHLEIQGHAVVDTGLRRSSLVGDLIDQAKQGHVLGKTTLALFYAVDFADQLENKIIPALSAGTIVLADRYIFTLMARAMVRGASREWAQQLYGFALKPDLTIFLDTRTELLMHRAFGRYGSLDYWESGMDLGLSTDRFESFFRYQQLLGQQFDWMAKEYDFVKVNANRSPREVHRDVRAIVDLRFDGHRLEEFNRRPTPRRPTARGPSGRRAAPTASG